MRIFFAVQCSCGVMGLRNRVSQSCNCGPGTINSLKEFAVSVGIKMLQVSHFYGSRAVKERLFEFAKITTKEMLPRSILKGFYGPCNAIIWKQSCDHALLRAHYEFSSIISFHFSLRF